MRRLLLLMLFVLTAAIGCSAQLPLKSLNLKLTPSSSLQNRKRSPRRAFRVPIAVKPEIDSMFHVEVYYNYGCIIPAKSPTTGKRLKYYRYSFDVIFTPRSGVSAEGLYPYKAYLADLSGSMVNGPCSSVISEGDFIVGRGYNSDWDTPTSFQLYFYNRPPSGAVCIVITDYVSSEGDPLVLYDAKGRCIAGHKYAHSSERSDEDATMCGSEKLDARYYWINGSDSCRKVTFPLSQSEMPLRAVSDWSSRKDGFMVRRVTLRKVSEGSDGRSLDDYQIIVNVTPSNSFGLNGDPLLNLFICGVCQNDISVIKHQRFDDEARENLQRNLKPDGTVDIIISPPFKNPENINSLRGVAITPFSDSMMDFVATFNDGELRFPE